MTLLVKDQRKYVAQTLRDYQTHAVQAIRNAWGAGEPAPLAALATGAGKTTIIAQLLKETVNPDTGRALVIGHTAEIIYQLYERIANQFEGALDGLYGLNFMPGIGLVMGENDSPDARIVVATRQSLHPERLPRLLNTGAFAKVIIDEAHHALGDNTYGAIMDALREANADVQIAGFTATPARTDRAALASIFSDIVYEWLIPEGIAQGYLVPVTRMKVATRVDVSAIRTNAGDYAQNRLISALDAANWLALCLDAYRQYVEPTGRQTLAFLPSVEMSKDFAAALLEQGVLAAHLDGTTPKDDRRKLLNAYTSGALKVVSNMAVLTEGFDAPATGCIFLGRPTRSRTLFTQIVGRGLRPFPGKHDCLLLDMTVVDTKALEIGTLLGRMATCKTCGVEFYASLRACPACGAPKPLTLREAYETGAFQFPLNMDVGQGLVADYMPLFERAFAAWYQGTDGFLSCTLTFEDGAYIIVPPLEDNYYRLAHVPKAYDTPIRYLDRNEDLASLLMQADTLIQKKAGHIAQKDAAWRGDPATPAQLQLLAKLGVKVTGDISKGTASQLITHAISVKRLINGSAG